MAKYVGRSLVIQFIDSNGTITISNQFNQFDTKWQTEFTEVSTGNAFDKAYLPTLADMTATYKGLSNGTASPLGTADLFRLEPQDFGTVIYAPLGTASGMPKGGFAAYVKSQDITYPYANKVEVSLEFQRSGTLLYDVNSATF